MDAYQIHGAYKSMVTCTNTFEQFIFVFFFKCLNAVLSLEWTLLFCIYFSATCKYAAINTRKQDLY